MAKVKIARMPMPSTQSQSVRIEKIQNGYLAHHSQDTPKGYQVKTVFHPQKPVVTVAATPIKGKKNGK